jgi:hypothetical protein
MLWGRGGYNNKILWNCGVDKNKGKYINDEMGQP